MTTTTTTGTNRVPAKHFVFAVIAAAIIALGLWAWSSNQRDVPAPAETAAEVSTEPQAVAGEADATSTGTSGLTKALADGKFDESFAAEVSPSSQAAVGTLTVTGGHRPTYDEGRPVGEINATTAEVSGLEQALANGKFDEDLAILGPTPQPSLAVPRTLTVSGGHQE